MSGLNRRKNKTETRHWKTKRFAPYMHSAIVFRGELPSLFVETVVRSQITVLFVRL